MAPDPAAEIPPPRPLSVVVPCYNEAPTIAEILARVAAQELVREIIVVDDASGDGTREILRGLAAAWPDAAPPLRLLLQPAHAGKSAALRAGFRRASAPLTIIQDADLEYDPRDYPGLVRPILDGDADVVYGSRFAGAPRRALHFWHSLGNRLLTMLSNMATDLDLSDMETGFKVFKTEILRSIPLRSGRFGFEAEITAKVARLDCRVYEVPVSYHGRTYAEGKKIRWTDGLHALWLILKYALVDDAGPGTPELALRQLRRARNHSAWVYDLLRPHLGREILEVGAGAGTLTGRLARHGSVTATDLSAPRLRELRKAFAGNGQVRVEPLDIACDAPPPPRPFDTVVCVNVLEQIEDDLGALRNMRRLLEPGGRVLLYVPANPRIYGEVDRGLGRLRRYLRDDLDRKLREAGFTPSLVRQHDVLGALSWWLQGRIFGRNALRSPAVRGLDALMPLFRAQDRLGLDSRFGLSILAVGENR